MRFGGGLFGFIFQVELLTLVRQNTLEGRREKVIVSLILAPTDCRSGSLPSSRLHRLGRSAPPVLVLPKAKAKVR